MPFESALRHVRRNAVAYVALFFALTGSAAAITRISLKPKVIKNYMIATGAINARTVHKGSLKGVDLARNTLTGKQINEQSLDPNVLQRRVSGTCPAGQAISAVSVTGAATCQRTGTGTVTSVGSGFGLTGGPITHSGSLAADPTILQERVSGTCSGDTALQQVDQNGNVICSGTWQPAGHLQFSGAQVLSSGGSAPLLEADGITVTATCASGPTAQVTISPSTGSVTAFSNSQSKGFVSATGTSVTMGSTTGNDRGDFNAFLASNSEETLDGSFLSSASGGGCTFEASGISK